MDIFLTLVVIACVMAGILGIDTYLILLERKVAAWVQDRYGPNRVGTYSLLQPIADCLKFLLKEQVIPKQVNKTLYVIAPAISVVTTLLAFAVVPFGSTPTNANPDSYAFVIAPKVDVGIVFIFAVTSLAVY